MNIQVGGGRRMGKGELLHRYLELAKAQGHNVFELPPGIQGRPATTMIVDELTLMRAHFEAMDEATKRAILAAEAWNDRSTMLHAQMPVLGRIINLKKAGGRERYLRRYRNIGLRRKR